MMEKPVALLILWLAVATALPHRPIIRKLSSGLRYQYAQDADGQLHLVDFWETVNDVAKAVKYDPDTQNIYHLFTRTNPSVSQVLVPGNDVLVWSSNFNATLRTAVLIHGWIDSATANFNAVLVPAFLEAEDLNVIVVDWCAGACTDYATAVRNTVTSALPHRPIIRKLSSGLRYQYAQDADGQLHLVDFWETVNDVAKAVKYDPDTQNIYHLFTRTNPSVSQVLVPGNDVLVWSSNFNATLRTAVLIHGWIDSATANFNAVLVPAFLEAEDLNVIVVDWCAGACTDYATAVRNTVTSGQGVARFINWLNDVTGADPARYHITGFSLGGQQAGVVGRNLGGGVDYVTSLDPAGPGWETSEHKFSATDGVYTEVIHTNAGGVGYLEPLGDVDFYPNGGIRMPGCSDDSCDHDRCYYYLAESLRSGGFTGQRCDDFQAALIGNCTQPGTLPMGGISPKFGVHGVYFLKTNSAPPFSQG